MLKNSIYTFKLSYIRIFSFIKTVLTQFVFFFHILTVESNDPDKIPSFLSQNPQKKRTAVTDPVCPMSVSNIPLQLTFFYLLSETFLSFKKTYKRIVQSNILMCSKSNKT